MAQTGHTSAPLSKPVIKKRAPVQKQFVAPPSPQRMRTKRPRPSDDLDDKPFPTQRKMSDREQDSYKREMYLTFIETALSEYRKGDAKRYNELLQQLRSLTPEAPREPNEVLVASTSTSQPGNASQIRAWLDVLVNVVSKLDDTHTQLVHLIARLPWASLDDDFVFAYARFCSALVSARPQWLRIVLEQCIKGFRYRSHFTAFASKSSGITRKLIYYRIHGLLRGISALIPTVASTLSPLLSLHFPTKRDSRRRQVCYLNNLLELSDYCPAVAETTLTTIVDRAIALDVEIQGDPEDWDEEEDTLVDASKSNTDLYSLANKPITADDSDSSDEDDEDDDDALDLDDLSSDDGEPDPVSDTEAEVEGRKQEMSLAAKKRTLEMRDKLDGVLKVLFDHFASVYSISPPSSPDAREDMTPTPEGPISEEAAQRRATLFATLLDIFDRTLLRTFKTRSVQFLLFYLCSLSSQSADHFVGVLLTRAIYELDQPVVTRVAAAGYVASFVSRARFIDASTTRKVITHLCRHIDLKLDELEVNGTASHLPVFYACTQAVMYIFCFRWRDLLEEGEDDEDLFAEVPARRWLSALDSLKNAIASPLNPLKICARPVVDVFAETAHETNFLYVYPLINHEDEDQDDNSAMPSLAKRGRTDSSSTLRPSPSKLRIATAPVTAQLDSFFPFDPFKLPESSAYIDDIYREWDGNDAGSTTNGESSDASSDTTSPWLAPVKGGLKVPGMSMTRISEGSEDDEVARSLEAMSLSPERNWMPSSSSA